MTGNNVKFVENTVRKLSPIAPGDELIISGIAGRFPESDNLMQLKENLLNKVDLVTDDNRRWKLDHPEIPQRTGKINDIEKFDASFFGVHFKQAHTMDPMCRMLLEHTFEAIVDAGYNPRQLRGKKIGVFMGACFSESEKTWFYEKLQVNGFGITGCSRAMLANRISYWLGVTGPSYTIDSACSSSFFALENAYRAIREGLCDAAIVGGANLCLHPYVSLQFSRLGVLSQEGKCKCFDASADGYTRSEAIATIFIQKAKDAKRNYATIIHAKINCDGYKEQGITFPSSVMQYALLKEFYEECNVSPTNLDFIEAHGTGTIVGDPEEINALDRMFCTGRNTPLKIGSVKSNLGHSEPASGLCSISKVIVSMEAKTLLPNLHYNQPREGVKALEEGRIKVVTEPLPWDGGLVGINSFGFGGANAHVLLKSNQKKKINNGAPKDKLPRLVTVSARIEEGVKLMLNDIESRPVDVEYVRLYHNIFSENIPGHLYRGYTIVGRQDKSDQQITEIQHYPGAKKPIWFIFSGMGSQWPGMGEALLSFPIFAKAIQKCDAVLKPRKIDIYDILTNKDKKTFDNILNSFVGIAAVQIGLVDLLNDVGIVPDNIIGHSVGELGCAYADGCFTAEQMILSAYSRGLTSIETKFIYGSMAAVGLGYQDLKLICPSDIEIACHNGPESCTISGPSKSMTNFINQLQANKIFAKEVPCSNIPYHSRYIAAAGPKLLTYLREVIPNPKPRSAKWLSTSVPYAEWSTTEARLSSAEYHTNNLLSPVLFEETSMLIPKDAITIEIAPHGLLQAILRKSLHSHVINIPLTQRGHKDNVEVVLQGLGKLYNVGLNPDLAKLYPEVQFPVSCGTPMISPFIKWEHSDDWYVTSYRMQEKITSGERKISITLTDEDYEFMNGHIIDGRNLLPATGYLTLIWETIGMMRGELYSEVPVIFEDIKFLRATTIPKEGSLELTIMVQKGTGRFEIIEGNVAIVTGMVHATSNTGSETLDVSSWQEINDDEEMTASDIYKELKLRGYQYTGLFRGLKGLNIHATKGRISWEKSNWCAFMDNMLQMKILTMDTRGLFVPTGIQKIVIDTKYHLNQIRAMKDEKKEFVIEINKDLDCIVAGGVYIQGLKASAISRKKVIADTILEEYKFVAYKDKMEITLYEALCLMIHVSLENNISFKTKTLEFLNEKDNISAKQLMSPLILQIFEKMPLVQADCNIVTDKLENTFPPNITILESKKLGTENTALLGIGHYLLSTNLKNDLQRIINLVKNTGFLITQESFGNNDIYENAFNYGLNVIMEKKVGDRLLLLLRKQDKVPKMATVVMVNNDEFSWVNKMKEVLKTEMDKENEMSKLLLVGQGDFDCGLIGLVNCLRKEPGGEIVYGILIQDTKAPEFSLQNPLYINQLQLDLVINVLRPGGVWGSYRHLPLPPLTPSLVHHAWANQLIKGDLNSLNWLEGPIQPDFKHEDIIHVVYSPINFRDIMLTTGKLATEVVAKTRQLQECVIGFEYCGIDSSGRRVMGMTDCRCLANLLIADKNLLWYIPDSWSLEDAATVPCVYGTCYYALYDSGKMKKGDKILIHAGSGGVGQAAINLALFEGCEVFTTVSTPEKRKFIRERFPQIQENHIGNSRDTSFEQLILKQTNGRGVDIVLNSLAEEKLQASVRCLAQGGRFLEIGKFDLAANNPLGMEVFLKEISFHGIMLDNLFTASKEKKEKLKNMLTEGLRNGAIKPLTRTIFPRDQLETAFRYMAAGKHIGKVLIQVRDKDKPLNAPSLALPRYHCLNECSYVILGGLGGFGLELADWMVLRGAKNLVLTSRTGISNGYQKLKIELWKSYGVKVKIVSGKDASKEEDCKDILKAAIDLAPIDGIFNLAVVLKDNLWENQTEESFETSFRSKTWSMKHLDKLTRVMCPKLRHFVVFSTISSGRGNIAQINYGMANSATERICERRFAEGLPGLAVQWGPVGDVGIVAKMQETKSEMSITGTNPQGILSCLEELDKFLQQNYPVVSSFVLVEKRTGQGEAVDIIKTVLNIMGLKDLKTVSQHTSLAELGMDSMMAIEIKQTLEREFEIFLAPQDIRSLTFAKLIEMDVQISQVTNSDSKVHVNESLSGMKLLVRVLGREPINPNVLVKLQTKEDEGREIFLIAGIEGIASVFSTLTPKLRSPAICLQPDIKNLETFTIASMADSLLPQILTKVKYHRNFVLVGYSYGSLITLELARRLEKEGLSGRIILIDGSPELLNAIKNQQLSSNSVDELQTNMLLGIMDLLAPANNQELITSLEKCQTWDEKLEKFILQLPKGATVLSQNEEKELVTSIYKRLVALDNYDYKSLPPLNSPICLLKPKEISVRFISEDYGLQKMTRSKLEIHYTEGNHITILDSDDVASAINGDPFENPEAFKTGLMENRNSVMPITNEWHYRS